MRSYPKILWAMAGLLVLVSCSHDQPTGPGDLNAEFDKSDHQVLINNYIVQFDGRSFDGETTTFNYTVIGDGHEDRMNQFRLELPGCAGEPISGYPATARVIEDADGVQWMKWPERVYGDDSEGKQFAVTYAGDVPEGMILSGVKVGAQFEYGDVPGACAGAVAYTISGTVFTDLDGDGELDFEELGIAGVVVELENAGEEVTTALTDAQGIYSFDATAGDYTLRISYDGYPEAFNAQLQASFDATTALEIPVSVGPDATGNAFGFMPRTEDIIEDLESGDLTSTGEGRIFWKQQVRWAIVGVDNPNVVHDRDELEAFLEEIQTLYLTEIFQFTPGNELEEVWEILRPIPHAPIDKLRQELLITELNEVSGRGMVDDPGLQDVLIAWGEAVWVDNQEAARAAGGLDVGNGEEHDVSLATPELIPPAIDIFTLINTGGGGGVDE